MALTTMTFPNKPLQPAHRPSESETIAVRLKPSTVYAAGTVIGEVTATPGLFGAYASGNADGTQTAKAVLKHAVATDAAGLVSYSDAANGDELGQKHQTAHAYVRGYFRTEDMTGLDAAAAGQLGRLISGSAATGLLYIS